ncbi:penicillin-binding transpeptidase domain-containing protein [Cellulomonas sp. ATA003]|uniref:penicillin-binding transpeptidase domain-containing protein n=1 Tax=Cellulomonas sp. ATA003 TaxID=3073064 RepID=UPI002873A8D2|nr:penicillin-binding transpeptidase domain-containing protein [Cellulomonas sp. ATA003]WNB87617.1 penicillin-binding transpeptidase domain-containing protein [Cellulomonas sp. ATA003]
MGAATWVQYVQAAQLNADPRNVRTLYREYDNFRGPIVVGGEPIASSTPVDDPFGFQRSYAQGPLYAHATGFYSVIFGRTGIERAANEVLTGTADSLFWSRIEDLVTGRQPQGSSVELTIHPAAQAAATAALGSQRGAVVALDPTTGAILALVSSPSFDPNVLAGHDTNAVSLAYRALADDPADPLVNRAIAGDTYPRGRRSSSSTPPRRSRPASPRTASSRHPTCSRCRTRARRSATSAVRRAAPAAP